MAKKIVTFYSLLRANAQEEQYDFPGRGDKAMLCGRQTNEAPLKYLLQTYCRPGEGATVIALCTPEAYTPVSEELGDTVTYIRRRLTEFCLNAGIVPLQVEEVKIRALEENLEDALGQVLERIEPGDEIYIDATGGPRDANFMNILLLQALTHKGCRVGEMVYSFFGRSEKRVRSLNEVTRVMNVTNAMAEFSTYGRTRLLEQAFPESPDLPPEIRGLKQAMTRFAQKVELCDYGTDGKGLEACLKEIREKIDRCSEAEINSPLLKQMLPVFRKKLYGGEDAPMLPTIVRWCAENHLIQQGLTIYSEKINAFWKENGLIRFAEEEKNGIVTVKDAVAPKFLLNFGAKQMPGSIKSAMRLQSRSGIENYCRDLPGRVPEVLQLWRNRTQRFNKDYAAVLDFDLTIVDCLDCFFDEKTNCPVSERVAFDRITRRKRYEEMLPLLREKDLADWKIPEDMIRWFAGERGSGYMTRIMRNRGIPGPAVDKIKTKMEQAWDLEEWSEHVSLRDLFLTILERELMRQLRNQTNHGGGAEMNQHLAECARNFKAIGINAGWNQDVNLEEVRRRLLVAADRLESLYEQAKIAQEYSADK